MAYIEEKDLENHPNKMNKEQMKISVEQMENCICRIKCLEGGQGTGFFLILPILNKWNSSLTALITNCHVLKKNEIMGKTINFSINDGKLEYEIKIDDSRKIYSNEKYDVTIIEIKKEDGVKKNSFLEIDNQIFEQNSHEKYRKQPIYLLHYPKGIEVEKADGTIGSIDENGEQIQHYCSTSPGSSGAPIINLKNQKVIGIHKGAATKGKKFNYGTYLKLPIEEFNELLNQKEKDNKDIDKNEINSSKYNENSQKNIKKIKNKELNNDFKNYYDEDAQTCKVILLGESGVGKTSLIARFINNTFHNNILSTTGASYAGKTLSFDEFQGKSIKFEIWDTAGQEKYRALTKIFYKDAHVAILLYDITNRISFEEIQKYWYNQIKEYAPENLSKKKYIFNNYNISNWNCWK